MPNDATIATHLPCEETRTQWEMLCDKGFTCSDVDRVSGAETIAFADSWPVKTNSALSSKLTRQVPPMWHSASSRSNDSAVRPSTKSARIALAHNNGGPTALSAGMILEGPGANGS
jgi:hypothetical protein